MQHSVEVIGMVTTGGDPRHRKRDSKCGHRTPLYRKSLTSLRPWEDTSILATLA